MPRPKRQHFVPKAYLERFARDGKVLVRRRDGRTFEADPINVAVEAGMYDVPTPTGTSSAIEEALAEVDDQAVLAMRAIDAAGRVPEYGSPPRQALSIFLALQITRTPEARERAMFPLRVAEYIGDRPLSKELMAEYLERVHLQFRPTDNEIWAAFDFVGYALRDREALTPAFMWQVQLASITESAPTIHRMTWSLEVDRKERLATSDTPMVQWRTPTPRDRFEGFGIMNAEEARFPLDPGKQLVLRHRGTAASARLGGERARSCNADLAAGCYHFIIGRPDQRAAIAGLPLAEHRPVMRFNTAPGFEVGPDGVRRPIGDILHTWVPRR